VNILCQNGMKRRDHTDGNLFSDYSQQSRKRVLRGRRQRRSRKMKYESSSQRNSYLQAVHYIHPHTEFCKRFGLVLPIALQGLNTTTLFLFDLILPKTCPSVSRNANAHQFFLPFNFSHLTPPHNIISHKHITTCKLNI